MGLSLICIEEEANQDSQLQPGIQMEPTLVTPGEEALVLMTNSSGFTCSLAGDTVLGVAEEV